MNTKLLLFALFVLLAQITVACGTATPAAIPTTVPPTPTAPPPAPTPTPEPTDPATIAQNFNQAINAGDIEAAMALVADDVKCRGECYFTGKDLFRAFTMSSINGSYRTDISDLKVDGDKVSYNWKVYSKAGFFQGAGTETLQIRDGLIVLVESVAQ